MSELLAILAVAAFLGVWAICICYQFSGTRRLGKISDAIENTNEVMKQGKEGLGLRFIDGGLLDDILHLVLFEPLDGLSEDTFMQLQAIINNVFKKKYVRLIGMEDKGRLATKEEEEGYFLHLKYVVEKHDYSQAELSFTKLRTTLANYRNDLGALAHFSGIDITQDKITVTQLMPDTEEKIAKPADELVSIIQNSSEAYFGMNARVIECKIGEKEHHLTTKAGEKLWAWDLITVFQLGSDQSEGISGNLYG